MRTFLARLVLVTVASASLAFPTALAHAQPLPLSALPTAEGALITKSEARALGIVGRVDRELVYTHDEGTPSDAPWLCDLDGDAEVEATGAPTEFEVEVFNPGGKGYVVENELHGYRDPEAAQDAYQEIRRLSRLCRGTVETTDGQDAATFRLSHGQGNTKEGRSFVWTYSRALNSVDARDFTDNYVTFTRIGSFVQVIELESLGRATGNLSESQRSEARKLTGVLAARARVLLPR